MSNNEEKNEQPIKPLLKNKSESQHGKDKKKKSVVWDTKTLAEQELDRKLHPVTMKIDEPKTPYIPYEGDDEYLSKITEVNKLKPTDEVLSSVISKLEGKKLDDDKEYLEVEIVEPDGTIKKELVKKDPSDSKEFLQKRHKAYANEFTEAKNNFKAEEQENSELVEQTINNTLFNKFAGKIKDIKEVKEEKDN